jgi:hypothetical protein
MLLITTIVALGGGIAETTFKDTAPAGARYRGPGTRHRTPIPAAIRRPRSISPWNTQTSTS